MNELWERVRTGRHTAWVGGTVGEPAPGSGVRVVRVRCDLSRSPLGPLIEARRKVEHLLGGGPPLFELALFDRAQARVVQGLRRRLLGDVPMLEVDRGFVELMNRLAQSSPQATALVLEAVDAADVGTVQALQRILGRPGWLKLPVVLAFRTRAPEGAAAVLLDALRATSDAGSVLEASGPWAQPSPFLTPARERASTPTPTPAREQASTSHELPEWRTLPPEVLRVLRAGAVVGPGFEVDLVAALLEADLFWVLEQLQRAADAGLPVEDLGDGRFHLPESLLDALRASMLPSLMIAWHQRLAELLREDEERAWAPSAVASAVSPRSRDERRSVPMPEEVAPVRAPAPPLEGLAPTRRTYSADEIHAPPELRTDTAAEPPDAGVDGPAPPTARGSEGAPAAWPYAEIFGPQAAPSPAPAWNVGDSRAPSIRPRVAAHPDARPRAGIAHPDARPRAGIAHPDARPRAGIDSEGPRPTSLRGDDARAARHLAAAGELDESAERYLAAARKAAEIGAHPQALQHVSEALAILEALPSSPRRKELRARLLLELGRLRWRSVTPGAMPGDPTFSLPSALEAVEAARTMVGELGDDASPELAAEVGAAIAGICYDLGDATSLARALDELTAASRRLLDAGDATGAARLLNDQAAVYVRLGDPVRATHLLSESRKIFEDHADGDPVAALEMAETDHLFARIPLHVPARPGREQDALTMGLDHALAAERTYRRQGRQRELARVWETMGRLEVRKGRLDRARERLTAAVEAEEALGDLVGLARSTAALSELLAVSGRVDDALALLADSVALNFEKGSPIGLAFNRRALAVLERAITAPSPALDETRARLEAAERALGRMVLPGERG